MAVADLIPEIWDPTFLEEFYQNNIWPALAADISGMVTQAGTAHLPKDDTDYDTDNPDADTFSQLIDPTADAHLQWGAPNRVAASTVDVDVKTPYSINRIIGTVQQAYVNVPFIQQVARNEARRFAETLNAMIRTEILKATQTVGAAITVSAANFAGAQNEFRDALLKSFNDAGLKANYMKWPAVGRVAVVSPRDHAYIRSRLVDKNINFAGPVYDNAVIDATLVRYEGWDIIPDNSLADGVTNADDAKHTMLFFLRNRAVVWGRKVNTMEIVNGAPVYKGTLVQGELTIGSKLVYPDNVMEQAISIT